VNSLPKTLYSPKIKNKQPTAMRKPATAKAFFVEVLSNGAIFAAYCKLVFNLPTEKT
jgi:hypothetical protein